MKRTRIPERRERTFVVFAFFYLIIIFVTMGQSP